MNALICNLSPVLPVPCGGYGKMDEWGWRSWTNVVGGHRGMNERWGRRAWMDEGLQMETNASTRAYLLAVGVQGRRQSNAKHE
jgi:hypothetical protein